jgi:modulator of FtsH protease HflC
LAFENGDTHLVLRPDSDFFRYFGDPSGKPPPDGVEAAAAPKSSGVQAPAAPKPSASK